MSSDDPWDLLIGEITSAQGLQGEAKVFPHTDFPERFEALDRVGVAIPGQPLTVMTIAYVRITGRRIVMKLDGIETREQVDALRGAQLLIPRSWAVELGEDEYFHHQLLGLEVITTTGEALGAIIDIWSTGANDVYETPLALIPAVKAFVKEIDLEHGRMVVETVPGMKKDELGA